MKYVSFCYNMLTLCRTLKYVNDVWGKENSYIIYADLVSPIPEQIRQDYNVVCIDTGSLDVSKRSFPLIFGSAKASIRAWKALDDIIKSTDEEVVLAIYRDNQVQEATMIEKMHDKYPERTHSWIIEEGSGIYAVERASTRFVSIKRCIYKLYGASTYSLTDRTQCNHPYLEKAICVHPDELREKRSDSEIEIEQMVDIFTPDLNEYIVKAVMGNDYKKKHYDYVYLTQPYTDYRDIYDELDARFNKLLPEMFSALSENGLTVIKPHPRENVDYSKYVNDKIDLLPEKAKILPFECLMQVFGNPQMISMFSSASTSIKTDKPSIYLCKAFDFPNSVDIYPKSHFETNNIVVCEDMKEFEELLRNE